MKVKAFGFDPRTARDVGELFLPEASKTLTDGSCPGWHNAIVEAREGCWTIDEKMGQTYVHHDQTNTLASKDYKQPQAVVYEGKK